jgi:Cytochrome bd terminal oxidase subunit I
MDAIALLLSRLQFAFTISFHIIFPAFSIGLAAGLTILEALHLTTGRPAYRVLFEFWLKIFGVAFGLGVVSGVVMAFQFGTNWSVLAKMSGPIQGPLLSYETFTAFALEASFFWRPSFWPVSRTCVVLSVLDRDGGVGDYAFGVLDHGQQHLDAGAGRLRGAEWRLRSR